MMVDDENGESDESIDALYAVYEHLADAENSMIEGQIRILAISWGYAVHCHRRSDEHAVSNGQTWKAGRRRPVAEVSPLGKDGMQCTYGVQRFAMISL